MSTTSEASPAHKTDWKTILAFVGLLGGIVFVAGRRDTQIDDATKVVAEQRTQTSAIDKRVEVLGNEMLHVHADDAARDAKLDHAINVLEKVDRHVIAECISRTHNPEVCTK